jgi:3-deoxy-manno-octulosonate cytidylyltransferase (CMP-KDO synthetase)
MTKVIGIVPARMGASRFPGKPLSLICGRPMIEHVLARSQLYSKWHALTLATCDEEIAAFARSKNWPVVMTASTHTRPLERVAEAACKCGTAVDDDDIVVCIQGDEPMLRPDMIDAVVSPFLVDRSIECTVLGMHITEERIFRDPDAVKIVHDIHGDVLYTSRSPIPFCHTFTPELGALRIYGILAFRNRCLQKFASIPSTPLELKESCDSNRLCGSGLKQRVVPYPCIPSFSVDTPAGRDLVERHIVNDPLWGRY